MAPFFPGDARRGLRGPCGFGPRVDRLWGGAGRRQEGCERFRQSPETLPWRVRRHRGVPRCEGHSYCVDVSACPLSTTCAGGIVMSAGSNVPAIPLHHAIVQRHFRDPITAAGDVRTSCVNSVVASNVARHRCRLTAGEAESRPRGVLAHRCVLSSASLNTT